MASAKEIGGAVAIGAGTLATVDVVSHLGAGSSSVLFNAFEPVGHAVAKGFEGVSTLLSNEKVVAGLAILFVSLILIILGGKALSGGGSGGGGHAAAH
jgi:hypothetical protein